MSLWTSILLNRKITTFFCCGHFKLLQKLFNDSKADNITNMNSMNGPYTELWTCKPVHICTYMHHMNIPKHMNTHVHIYTCIICTFMCIMKNARHTCTTYTYVHHMQHQTHTCTTKNKTYLVGLPFALIDDVVLLEVESQMQAVN